MQQLVSYFFGQQITMISHMVSNTAPCDAICKTLYLSSADQYPYRKCQDYVYKMRVLKYYVENKAQLETWK